MKNRKASNTAIDADPSVVGNEPLALHPGRQMSDESVAQMVMGFGDGHHRCPGSYLAIEETDLFLQRLLAIEGLRMIHAPVMSWNDLVTGYELRSFILRVE